MRVARPPAQSAASAESVHRLHPSSRRGSLEMSTEKRSTGASSHKASGSVSSSRDSRPPPSMRGFSHVPTYPEPSPRLSATRAGPVPAYQLSSSRRGSATSLSSPLGGPVSVSTPASPGVITPSNSEFSFGLTPTNVGPGGSYPAEPPVKSAGGPPLVVQNDRRVPRTARIGDLERIDSLPESTRTNLSQKQPAEPARAGRDRIVNVLPEPVQQPEPQPAHAPAKGSKKLSKGGGKLVKKSRRMSSSSVKPPGVVV
jgi:hypothetical protein